jgi:hypothetical protein
MLDKMIYENGINNKDPQNPNTPVAKISCKDFHEKEVQELLIYIYYTFYNTMFSNLDYEPIDQDFEFLKKQYGGSDSDEYRSAIRTLDNGEWKPKFDINLDLVTYYEIPDEFKTDVLVTKENGFSCRYSYPRYGDIVEVRDFINKIWEEEDKQFAAIGDMIRFRRDAEERFRKGENINLRSIPQPPKKEMEKFKEYEERKTVFIIQAARALHLKEYRGQNVEKCPLEERVEFARDPELDYSTFDQISKHFTEMKVGMKEEIPVKSPIQGKMITRRYSFRIDSILQALRDTKPAGVTVQFV